MQFDLWNLKYKMKIRMKFIYFVLIIWNTLYTSSLQLISQDHCDAEDFEVLEQWHSQLYDCLRTNQNVTQQLLIYQDKLHNMQVEVKDTNQQISSLKGQLAATKLQLKDQQLKCCGRQNEIVILRRQDGSEDFFRTWHEYRRGFGNTSGEFFIGLEKLHKLTNSRPCELLVILEDFENDRRYAKYDQFVIGSEKEKYALKILGTYQGTAGDDLTYHKGHQFSTKDQDNDASKHKHCAVKYTGAWWYNDCHKSNLNGRYLKGQHTEFAKGVNWNDFRGYHYSLKFVEMILRPN